MTKITGKEVEMAGEILAEIDKVSESLSQALKAFHAQAALGGRDPMREVQGNVSLLVLSGMTLLSVQKAIINTQLIIMRHLSEEPDEPARQSKEL